MQTTTSKLLREAVASQSWSRAQELLQDFRADVETAWTAAAGNDVAREEIERETTELMEWARVSILTSRTHLQSKLVSIRRSDAYLGGPREAGAFKLEG